jgi:Cytochrome c7 and related cytochrome c
MLGAAAALAAAALLFVACRQHMPTNRFLQPRSAPATQSTADALRKFDHAKHAKIIDRAGLSCGDCHRFDMAIDTGNEELAHELSMRALYPGAAACHSCHGVEVENGPTYPGVRPMLTAPKTCMTCHDNLAPLRPADHDLAWNKVHASMARTNPVRCEGCHRQSECISCHQRRDTIETRVHDRNFRFFHAVAARANPMQCGSCHREDFCIGCHTEAKVKVQQ